MKNNDKIHTVLVFLFLLAIASSVFAYRPFGTEDAGVAGKGVFQTEASWDYLKWMNGDLEQSFLYVPIYGLTDQLELSAEIPYLIHQTHSVQGVGDINVAGKYLLLPEDKHPAFTVKSVVKLNSGDFNQGLGSGDRDYSLFAVFTKTIRNLILSGQLGYTWVGKSQNSSLRDISLYGLAADLGLTDAFHLCAEINGNRHPDITETDDPKNLLIGLTYNLSERAIFDLAAKVGLSKSSPEWGVSVGLSATL